MKIAVNIGIYLLFFTISISCNKYELEKEKKDIVGLWVNYDSEGGYFSPSYLRYEKYNNDNTWFYFPGIDALCSDDQNCDLCPNQVFKFRNNDEVSDTLNYWIKGDMLIRERRVNILDRNSSIITDTLIVVKITNPPFSKSSIMRIKPWNNNSVKYFENSLKIGETVEFQKAIYRKSFNSCTN